MLMGNYSPLNKLKYATTHLGNMYFKLIWFKCRHKSHQELMRARWWLLITLLVNFLTS